MTAGMTDNFDAMTSATIAAAPAAPAIINTALVTSCYYYY